MLSFLRRSWSFYVIDALVERAREVYFERAHGAFVVCRAICGGLPRHYENSSTHLREIEDPRRQRPEYEGGPEGDCEQVNDGRGPQWGLPWCCFATDCGVAEILSAASHVPGLTSYLNGYPATVELLSEIIA